MEHGGAAARIMIPSAAKWCVYLSSRQHSPSGRRRAESSANRLLFLFYGRDSAIRSPLLLSRQTAGQYWTLNHLWAAALQLRGGWNARVGELRFTSGAVRS